jgi:hypothetical protein
MTRWPRCTATWNSTARPPRTGRRGGRRRGGASDAALGFYLSKADPLLVLRDLLGHSTVLTTEKYLRRLDTTRIYRDAYEQAGAGSRLMNEREAAAEFPGDGGDA